MPCENCHTFTSWKPIRNIPEFDHDKTKFPLRGLHTNLSCRQCHSSLVFSNAGTKCADCHADIHRRQFGANCESCHTVKGWQISMKSINQHTNRFPLMGAHRTLDCESCHKGAGSGQYVGLSTDCYSCHAKDYKAAQPDHAASGFSTNCQDCHTMDTFFGAKVDHAKFGFPLTGAHATLACTQCHIGGRFKGTPADCFSCHAKDYNGTTNPSHVSAGFSTTCQSCHTTLAWTPATFNHNLTKFPLTGAHTTVPCASCHVGGKYAGTPTDCYSCHTNDYNKTTNPNHVQSGFPTTCDVCHNTTAWQPASFDHSKTAFPLTGAHITVPCASCHVNGKYAGTPKDCYSCHINDWKGTNNPSHAAAGFPTDCSICHSTTSWAGAKFDHNQTKFPLTGAHVTLSCVACHASGKYAGLSTACVSCHQNDFNGAKNPDHVAAGFPTTCEVCHSTTAWQPSTFNHSNTAFPLTGAHIKVACASCHINGQYAGTPTDCYSCHKTDYLNVTNPNHVAAAFPTTCTTCHNTTSWLGATFNHTWFPIYSGTHQGKWTTCADCHTNPSNYASFSCITCHAHDKATADAQHTGVRNYVYNSANCYSCHPQGTVG